MLMMTHQPILLLEPNPLLRQTVGLTASSIGAGPVFQALNVRMARQEIERQEFASAMLALPEPGAEDEDEVMQLIAAIRDGMTCCAAGMPVYVSTISCDRDRVQRLQQLQVERILIKPFRARVLIEALLASRDRV